jgi:UDP-N-acetylmuramate: L-alanyl-gamma-D-glutamyl-meso-diaminopimelate ligase
MHIHILGICGTFMGSMAVLAKELGHHVTGSDANVYPPMSTQLEAQGIELTQGYDPPSWIRPGPGGDRQRHVAGQPGGGVRAEQRPAVCLRPAMAGRPRAARPLGAGGGRYPRQDHHQQHAGLGAGARRHEPGLPDRRRAAEFSVSARLGDTPFFVVEADEYDSAFFDKRSKFVHYRPRTAILNNLEFDHADIFPDLQPSSGSSTTWCAPSRAKAW